MNNPTSISRRAALLGAAVSTAALAAPVAAAVKPTTIEALAEKFRNDAMTLDPRINECWVGYDELAKGPRDMRVMSVYFGRSRSPFLKPAAPAPDTISGLFEQWLAAGHDGSDESEDQANERWKRYVALQRRITSMRPHSAREAAMQFVVETDDGGSDYRKTFFDRVRRFAMEG